MDDLQIECGSCGDTCQLIHLSEYEIREIVKAMDDGLCEICSNYESLDDDIAKECENCDGVSNWQLKKSTKKQRVITEMENRF